MKILMVTNGLGIGGAETHIVELSKALVRRGYEVIICSNGGDYVPEAERAGIRHVEAPLNRRSIMPMLRSYAVLRRIIKEEKPDIVHAHARIPGFLCGLIKKTKRFSFVATAHWVFDVGRATRLLTNWGDRTVAVSEDIKEYLKVNYGVPEEHIFVTINGIDTEKFSPEISDSRIRREFNIGSGAPVIAHVSRMDESRALAARKLIEIAPRLAEKIPGLIILIAGAGDVFDELCGKADSVNEALGYKCVIMAGARTDINEIVAAGDIFVGVSRAALEAMSAAKPSVIAGNEGYIGVFSEDKLPLAIESNFCCRGCEEISADRLYKDIISLMTMPEGERNALGSYGRSVIMEHYSVKRMADDTERAYRAALPVRKILMSGYYGCGNAGDEAILESVYRSVKENVPASEVTVLSSSPEETARVYGCKAAARFNPIALFREIRRCDTLVFGGGSLLQDTTSTRSLMYYLFVIRLAERLGKKVMLYANGIGPISGERSRRRTARAVSGATKVTLRDPESEQELRSMGVERRDMLITADPVFLLEPGTAQRGWEILKKAGAEKKPFFAVSIRPWKDSAFEAKIAEICDEIVRKYNLNAVFITMQPGADDEVSRRTAARMKEPSTVLSGSMTPSDMMAVIGESEFIISMRLHSLIFAARSETPAIGISYDPKLDAYIKMLGQPSAGSIESLDVSDVLTKAEDVYRNREGYVTLLGEKRRELTEKARINGEVLKNM